MIKTYKPCDTARIEAMLFTQDATIAAIEWANGDVAANDTVGFWKVKTLEGWVDMPYGSYLVRGTSGEFYPCDSDIFKNRWVETNSDIKKED